ncbi:MAG: serine hydrolase [bacterium]|nr:serine hydrolase [bacterium]
MRTKVSFFLGFLLTVVTFSVWQVRFSKELLFALDGQEQIVSPFVNKPVYDQKVLSDVTTIENNLSFGQILPEKEVLARGAYVFDLSQGKLLFEKDSHTKLQAASTIKIVTAAVALDKGKLDEEMAVSLFSTMVGESSQNLLLGEKFSLEELLYGLLLTSGNDTAETIAQGVGGRREVFIGWMNDLAKKVGARDTNFTNPSGLEDEEQYTTAYDLYLLGSNIFQKYPQIASISVSREKYLPKSENHRAYLLKNKLLLLDEFPLKGGKPGLGTDDRLSLVALLEKDGHKILVALIQTPSIKHDLTQILSLL